MKVVLHINEHGKAHTLRRYVDDKLVRERSTLVLRKLRKDIEDMGIDYLKPDNIQLNMDRTIVVTFYKDEIA